MVSYFWTADSSFYIHLFDAWEASSQKMPYCSFTETSEDGIPRYIRLATFFKVVRCSSSFRKQNLAAEIGGTFLSLHAHQVLRYHPRLQV